MIEIQPNLYFNLFFILKQGYIAIVDTSSIFSNHNLKPLPTHQYPILRETTNHYLISSIFFFVFILYVAVKIIEEKKLLKVFASVFSLQAAKQLLREDYRLNKRIGIFLSICYILVMAFLLFICNQYFNLILENKSNTEQYLFFVIVLILMYTIKLLITKGICYVTQSEEIEKEYVFNVLVFSHTMGIVLFPIMVCLQFSKYPAPFFLYPGLIIYGSFFILRLLRSFVNLAFEQNIGIFYIFLYFWLLEIMPLLILIKFLLVNF